GGVWWIRYYRNGRRYEESAKTSTWETARDLLRDKEGEISKGVPVSPKAGKLTFADARRDFENDYSVNNRKALEHAKRRLRLALEPAFSGRRMADISTPDVRAYIAARQAEGAANATINRELAILKRMYTLAMQAGKLLHRPHIPMLKERNARQGFFER